MIKFIWNAWRHPDRFLFVKDIRLNLLVKSESGENEWTCGFEIISLVPWRKKIDISVEMREPDGIAGMTGEIEKVMINSLSRKKVFMTRFPMTDKRRLHVENCMQKSAFLPIRLMIRAKSGSKYVLNESVNFIFRRSE